MSQTTVKTGISHVAFVEIQTRDVDQAIDFYTNTLGFAKTTDAPMGPGARWVELTPPGGNTRLTLISQGNPAFAPERIGQGFGAVFEVAAFEETCAELKRRGVPFDVEPRKEPWGAWAEILDPDGNSLGLHGEA
ncbi:MAG TPA: VOC family protein [Oscillatoriaceae cyanobacterium]